MMWKCSHLYGIILLIQKDKSGFVEVNSYEYSYKKMETDAEIKGKHTFIGNPGRKRIPVLWINGILTR